MATPSVLPNPTNFLGVALVINRTRDGPQFVFHYPPHIPPGKGHNNNSAYEDGFVEEDDWLNNGLYEPSPSLEADLYHWKQDEHVITDSGTHIVPWEHLAGFPTKYLEGLLTPARAYHKRLFQVSLESLYCVSYPIYIPGHGSWSKKKKKKKKGERGKRRQTKETKGKAPTRKTSAGTRQLGTTQREHVESANRSDLSASGSDFDFDNDNNDNDDDCNHHEEDDETTQTSDHEPNGEIVEQRKGSIMTMFNLVFFLNPEKHQAKDLIDLMYVHIIKKINKAYKYCQQRSDFVWKESKRMLALKDKAREERRRLSSLWPELLATSSLAASMQDLYLAVSQNKIAALQLDTTEGMVTHSVQIPTPFYVSDLPPVGTEDKLNCGAWITTANSFRSEDLMDDPEYIEKNLTLLLMHDEQKIISELQVDADESTLAMIEFVRRCNPTLSFHQIRQQSSNVFSAAQVRKYSHHFIYWRRAIAIPPLHQRDIYILSPNCDLSKMARASAEWTRAYPLAPPLPNFLADLSAAPRPYKAHIPTKAHRRLYLNMLAWLMRGGWVTQVCTFAYIVVWPEIIYEVDYYIEGEEIAREKEAQQQAGGPSVSHKPSRSELGPLAARPFVPSAATTSSPSPTSMRERAMASRLRLDGASDGGPEPPRTPSRSSTPQTATLPLPAFEEAPPPSPWSLPRSINHDEPTSPHSATFLTLTSPTNPVTSGLPPAAQPTPVEEAAEKARLDRLADRAARELADKATQHARRPAPTATPHPSINHAPHLANISPIIILDAKKATGRESRYLEAIARRLRAGGAGPPPPLRRDKTPQVTKRGGPGREGTLLRGGRGGGGARDGQSWDEHVAYIWPRFLKYFNGRSALERIALQEDMKRREVWSLLTAMSEYLLTVRHW